MTNRDIIAEIRLAPGEIGYYDEYSRIYLTNQNPVAKVYAGTNTTQIVRSVASGRLLLISGTFDLEAVEEKQAEPKEKIRVADVKASVKEEKKAPEKTEKIEKVEEPEVEKVVEPEKHVRKTRRTKKTETVVEAEKETVETKETEEVSE